MELLCGWMRVCVSVCVAVTLGVCAAGASAASLAPAVHVVGKLAWSTSPSSADLSFIAAHDSLLITDAYPIANSKVGVLHADNPSVTVIPYINGLERSPDDHIYAGSCAVAMVNYSCPAAD